MSRSLLGWGSYLFPFHNFEQPIPMLGMWHRVYLHRFRSYWIFLLCGCPFLLTYRLLFFTLPRQKCYLWLQLLCHKLFINFKILFALGVGKKGCLPNEGAAYDHGSSFQHSFIYKKKSSTLTVLENAEVFIVLFKSVYFYIKTLFSSCLNFLFDFDSHLVSHSVAD